MNIVDMFYPVKVNNQRISFIVGSNTSTMNIEITAIDKEANPLATELLTYNLIVQKDINGIEKFKENLIKKAMKELEI